MVEYIECFGPKLHLLVLCNGKVLDQSQIRCKGTGLTTDITRRSVLTCSWLRQAAGIKDVESCVLEATARIADYVRVHAVERTRVRIVIRRDGNRLSSRKLLDAGKLPSPDDLPAEYIIVRG